MHGRCETLNWIYAQNIHENWKKWFLKEINMAYSKTKYSDLKKKIILYFKVEFDATPTTELIHYDSNQ